MKPGYYKLNYPTEFPISRTNGKIVYVAKIMVKRMWSVEPHFLITEDGEYTENTTVAGTHIVTAAWSEYLGDFMESCVDIWREL